MCKISNYFELVKYCFLQFRFTKTSKNVGLLKNMVLSSYKVLKNTILNTTS